MYGKVQSGGAMKTDFYYGRWAEEEHHGYAQPARRLVVQVGANGRVFVSALPMKLHLDSTLLIGVDFFTGWADYGGGLDSVRAGFG